MRWYEIHQSEVIRERLREAERARLAAEAERARRPVPRDPKPTASHGRTVVAAALGGLVGWFAGR